MTKRIRDMKYLARYSHSFILAWDMTRLATPDTIPIYQRIGIFCSSLSLFWHKYYKVMDWNGMGKKSTEGTK